MKLFLGLLFALLPAILLAQDLPITGYPADTNPTCDDLILTINDPSGTPVDRKVRLCDYHFNVLSSSAPTVNDDSGDGYIAGKTMWLNTSTGLHYLLTNASLGAAVWTAVGSGGGAGDIEDVTAGAGLTGGGSTGPVTLDVAVTSPIALVGDTVGCPTCLVTETGDISDVVAGSGLTGGGATGAVTLNVGVTAPITAAADSIGLDPAAINLSSRTGVDFGSSDSPYVASLALADTAYITNGVYILVPNTANIGAASVNYNSLGIKNIKKVVSGAKVDLATNDFCAGGAGGRYLMTYDGVDMVVLSTLCNPSATTPGGSSGQVQVNIGGAFSGDAGLSYDPATDALAVLGNLAVGNVSTNRLNFNTSVITGTKTLLAAANADAVLIPGNAATATALLTKSIHFGIGSDSGSALADTADELTMWRNNIGAMTITEVWCESDAGSPIINLQRDDGSPANILSSNLTCSTTGATGTIVGAESVLASGDKIDFVMVTAGGVAKRVAVGIKATLN